MTAVALLASAFSREIWQLTIFFGLLAGLGSGLVASVLGPTVANRWFIRDRGLVVGVFGASVSAGQLIFFPFLTTLAVTVGWRAGALVMAIIALVLLVPVVLWLRDDPADLGLRAAAVAIPPLPRRRLHRPTRGSCAGPSERPISGSSPRPSSCAARPRTDSSASISSAHAADHGITPVAASGALAVMGAFNFVGTIASGWLTDRWDPRKLLLIYYGFRGVSLLFLPFVHDQAGIVAFSILFGLDYIATVPPTVALVADNFGRHNVGIVYGWVFAAHQAGAAVAALAAGIVREQRRRLHGRVRRGRLDRDHRGVRCPGDPSRPSGRRDTGRRGCRGVRDGTAT